MSQLRLRPRNFEPAHWKRLGANAASAHLARGDYCYTHLIELTSSGESAVQHHPYDAIADVLDGNGSTVGESAVQHHPYDAIADVLDGNGSTVIGDTQAQTRHFEWKRGSLLSIPLDFRYQCLNATTGTSRIAITTTLPMS